MRKVGIVGNRFAQIEAVDEPEFGANHEYHIASVAESVNHTQALYGTVKFQKGPIKEFGVNGCHHEDLIAIVLDRLQSFQDGPYKCRENAIAITKLEEALHWLNHRTTSRQARGVEGTSEV
jgi:hypothetical protein